MSFSFTMLLAVIVFFCTKTSERYIFCTWRAFKFSLLASFFVSCAVPLLIDLRNLNEGLPFLAGTACAFILPTAMMLLCRGLHLLLRALQIKVNLWRFHRGLPPVVINFML